MNRRLFAALTATFVLTAAVGFARSVWDNYRLFDRNFQTGDLVRVVFSEKTMIRYESQIKQTYNQNVSGTTPRGSLFDFFPEAGAAQNDDANRANTTTVKLEDEFSITAAVEAVSGNILLLKARNSSVIGGESFIVSIEAACDARSVSAERSVNSVDLFDLNFNVENTPATNGTFTGAELIFRTNYTDIRTNRIVDTAGVTNLVVATNMSSMKFEVSGITDEAKRRMIIRYLNLISGSLFQ